MAYCHIVGGRANEQRICQLKSIRFEMANTMHMHKDFAHDLMRKWAAKVHSAAKDSGVPPAVESLEKEFGPVATQTSEDRASSFDWRVMQMNRNAANHVRLAGFVQAKSLERNRASPDGKPLNDRLVVLLRQTEDPDKCIPIRWYQRNLEPLANTLVRGMPIVVAGEFRLDVKAVSAPDPETGIAPVSKVPYIHAKDIPGPVQPDSGLIRIIPYWADELFQAYGKSGKGQPNGEQAPASAVATDADRSAIFAAALKAQPNG
jgi:hypothetical protein